MNIQRVFYSPFFVHLKKHFCPKCSACLKIIKLSRVIDSRTAEAKDFDFSAGPTDAGFLFGKVKFIWNEFKCPNCGTQIKIKDMRKLEKDQKKQ